MKSNSKQRWTEKEIKALFNEDISTEEIGLIIGRTASAVQNQRSRIKKKLGIDQDNKRVMHGGSKTNLYHTWFQMKTRCNSINDKRYNDYGGRGIKVYSKWQNDFSVFRDWAYTNGYIEGLSIDRINNDGNYEPSNCRWTNNKVQCNNRRSNIKIEINGETHNMMQWAEITGVHWQTIRRRYKSGVTGVEIISPFNKITHEPLLIFNKEEC